MAPDSRAPEGQCRGLLAPKDHRRPSVHVSVFGVQVPLSVSATQGNTVVRAGPAVRRERRGIRKIEAACRSAGTPAPVFRARSREVSVTFPFLPGVMTAMSSPRGDDRGNDVGEDPGDDPRATDKTARMLAALAVEPTSTHADPSRITGFSARTVAREIGKLRDSGAIRRLGSGRQGRWQIVGREAPFLPEVMTAIS